MKLVTVVRTFSPAEAQLLRSRLEAAGLPALVNHETAAMAMDGYSMATGGVLVQTDAAHLAEARALLELPPLPDDRAESTEGPVVVTEPEPEPVTVFQTLDPTEADLVRSRLEAAGFAVQLARESAPLYLSPITTGTIRIQVPAAHALDAQAVLAPRPPADEPQT